MMLPVAVAEVTFGRFTTPMAWEFSLEGLGEAFCVEGLTEVFCVALSD